MNEGEGEGEIERPVAINNEATELSDCLELLAHGDYVCTILCQRQHDFLHYVPLWERAYAVLSARDSSELFPERAPRPWVRRAVCLKEMFEPEGGGA